MRKFIKTELAPFPQGCYSQAIVAGDTLYLAGQIGLDPVTTQMKGETCEEQLTQIFQNIAAVLQAAGSDLSKVVKLTVYLKNLDQDRGSLDTIMANFFITPYPARTTIGVARLPLNALAEVDTIAVIS